MESDPHLLTQGLWPDGRFHFDFLLLDVIESIIRSAFKYHRGAFAHRCPVSCLEAAAPLHCGRPMFTNAMNTLNLLPAGI